MDRIDHHPIPNDNGEIRLFCKIRNEADRLDHFIAYYEAIGVSRFFIIDNCSNDDTLSVLAPKKNCHVFSTSENMSNSRAGMLWITPLLNQYGLDHWCLIVDADELLIYNDIEATRLPEFCKILEKRNEDALFCMMLDMYPDGDVTSVRYQRGQAFIDVCPFFDQKGYSSYTGYRFARRMIPSPNIYGGPRSRRFYPEFSHTKLAWIERVLRHKIATSILAKWIPAVAALKPVYPPLLSKVPLVKWSPEMEFTPAAHFLKGGRMSRAAGVLLHFKFLGNFKARVENALVRNVYHASGAEYKRYHQSIADAGVLNFMCEASTRFNDSKSLVELGLVKPFPAANNLVRGSTGRLLQKVLGTRPEA